MDQQTSAESPRASGDSILRPSFSDLVLILSLGVAGAVVTRDSGDGMWLVAGLVLGFVVSGLRAAPGRLIRRVASAYVALACILLVIGCVVSLGFCAASLMTDWSFGRNLNEVDGVTLAVMPLLGILQFAVYLLPIGIVGGGIAWIIRSWHPAKA